MKHDVIPFTGQTVDVPNALPPAPPSAPPLPHHTINYKAIGLAYVIEGVVIAGGLYAGWEFAEKYAADDDKAWMMAIIGVIVIAVAELARVPLAQLAAGHKNMARKILAVIGVLMMCAVTVKSLSQVMEQMFHPRAGYHRHGRAGAVHRIKRSRLSGEAARHGSDPDIRCRNARSLEA